MSSFPAPRYGVLQLSLLFVLATAARAGFVHQRWTAREGLPVNSVTDVLQSRQGYLWLTTFDGLVRFDGVRFVTFTDANTPGLGSNRLTSLVETSDGKLLLTSEAGDLSLFDPAALAARTLAPPGTNQRFMVARPDGEIYVAMRPGLARLRGGRLEPVASTQLGTLDIVAIAFDEGGGIWLGCRGRGLRHLRANGTVEAITTADGLSSDMVLSLFVAPDGVVWAGGDRGVDVVRGREVHAMLAAGRPWSAYVHQIARHPDGSLVFVTETGLFRYRSGELIRFDSDDRLRAPLHPVKKAADGAVWVATATAVLRDGVAVFRLPEPERTRIRTMMFDDDGNVWIAASGGGLHQLRRAVFEGISVEEGLSAREVYPLAEDKTGAIWIGTQKGGLNRYAHGAMRAYGLADGLLDDNIKAILEDRAGTLWIGTYEAGLFRREGDRFIAERIPGVSSASLRVFALFEDRAGALWAGTSAGLLRRSNRQWTRIDSSPSGELPISAIVRVIRETDGALWIGTHGNGVARWSGGRFTWFTTGDGLASNRVRDLYATDSGVLWVATEDRGLSRIALGGGGTRSIVSVGSAQGLPAAGIHQIVPDGHGWLWMSTNHGIFRVEERILEHVATGRRMKFDAVLFSERDGMRSREANGGVQSAALRTRDGELWFATIDGVAVAADPDPRKLAPPPVRVALEGVTANGREHRLRDALELAAEDRSFRIDYTGFSFASPERIRFRYRLDGFDADWIEAGTRRSAFFTNVPPGRYRFRLQASNDAAGAPVWSEHEAVLPLTVRPWFYETLWFRVFLGVAALTVLYIAHRLRTRWLEHQRRELTRQVKLRTQTIEEQAAQLRELDRQKSRFFADLSHELRTPLTLIIGPLEDARRELEAARAAESTRPAVEGAIRNAHALLDLTNQLLDLAKLQSGKFELDRRDDDLVALLVEIAERFAPLARQRGIAFAHALPEAPVIAGFDRRQLARVIENLLSNAFKFTPQGGSVRLTLALSENLARIGVADTGPGIAAVHLPRIFDRFYQADDPSGRLQPGTGIGLAMVRELTTLHGGSLEVASTIGVGTSFTVVLPLVEATFASNETSVHEWASAEPADQELMTIHADRATILIVDDEEEIRAYLRRHLEPRYRVLEAGDGETALAIVSEALPDLVVADVMMPRLDGFDLCRAIKADREIDFIPIILLTARAGTDDRLEGLGSLADDYVTKPFDARELLARADNLIALRRRLRERFASAATEVASDPNAFVPFRPSEDELYRQRLIAAIDRHLSDETFRVADLSRLMAQDRTQLFRRTRDLTGEAPSDLIRNRRLARAAELLRAREGQVGEVAYAVGFNSVSYFIKCFRESYGVTPARFAETSNADS